MPKSTPGRAPGRRAVWTPAPAPAPEPDLGPFPEPVSPIEPKPDPDPPPIPAPGPDPVPDPIPAPIPDPSTFIPSVMDLPVLRIATLDAAPVVSLDDYVGGHLTLDPHDGSSSLIESDLTIKGRGNTSWALDKKGYKIKFASKTSLLGMPADKEWALLANHDDKTLLRNATAFELSRRLGMAWTPRSKFIEVFLNDQYIGTYQLTETIKISNDRLNIKSLDVGDVGATKISGGYLMEIDHNDLTQTAFTLSDGAIPLILHDPDPPAAAQLDYISSYMQTTGNTLYSADFANPATGYSKYIDVDSFINWYLVNEIFKNNDAIFWSSVYLYKDRNAKLFMGPVWDFDLGLGNASLNQDADPVGWWVRNPWVPNGQWLARLFEDRAFRLKVQARWNVVKASQIDTLPAYINQSAFALNVSEQNNFQRWPVLNTYILYNPQVAGSYEGELAYMQGWLKTRIDWMDGQINSADFVDPLPVN